MSVKNDFLKIRKTSFLEQALKQILQSRFLKEHPKNLINTHAELSTTIKLFI